VLYNFISIPRCASQTIHAALGTNKKNNHMAYSKLRSPNPFSFAVIRDPVERLQSWFWFHKKKYANQPKVVEHYKEFTFERWVAAGMSHHWDYNACKSLGIKNPLSQYDFVRTEDEEIGPNKLVDFKRFELQINSMKSVIGGPFKFRHTGLSHRPKQHIDKETVFIIRETFPMDFELYEIVRSNM
jgi:hypothetical protein